MPSIERPDYGPLHTAKVDAAVLALLHLNSWIDRFGEGPNAPSATAAWKSLNWDALDRLHAAGLISDPRRKARSVGLTPEGAQRAAEACRELFGSSENVNGPCSTAINESDRAAATRSRA